MTFALRRFAFAVMLIFLLSWAVTAQESFPRVSIAGSEIRTLKSSNTGRTYDLYVHVPNRSSADRKYPVLYVLDGQWDFKLLDSVYGGLFYDKFVPEMIIVGITYAGTSPNYDALRAIDYTPVAEVGLPGSGDGPKFYAFLKQELLPFIEKNYHGDPSRRILMGSSLGGLFTLYALFTEPDLFFGYVSASPAVPVGQRFAFKQEADFAARHRDLATRLFISVGDIEDLASPVKEYISTLKSRGYKSLKLDARVLAGERHSGNKPEAFNRGLRFVFQD